MNSTASGAWASGSNCETSIPGQVTLRSAVEALNAAGAGTRSITFSLPNPSVIKTTGTLQVTKGPLVITGPGARAIAVDGQADHTLFGTDADISLTMSGITVRNGFSGLGAGFQVNGPLTLDHVAITGNKSTNSAGAINVARGMLTISNSLIANNEAGQVAGIELEGVGGSLTNVTIANNVNTAASEGIAVEVSGGAALSLNFVTVAGNTFRGTPSPSDLPAAGIGVHDESQVTFHNSVIANNQGANCRSSVPVTDRTDTAGSLVDNGYNLDSANDCGFTQGSPHFDAVKAAANLGTLKNNGGQTDTFALAAGSRAIDTADPACGVPTDQRGVTRPQGSRCDMGAFEVLAAVVVASPSPSATPVLPRAGSGSGWQFPGLLLALGGFAVLSVLVLARATSARRPPGS